MTERSQNGWTVDPGRIASYTIPGTTERVALRHGAVAVVLLDIAGFVNAEVEPLQQKTLDEWGYANRPIRGSTVISNHASGTAIDIDASRHPLGVTGTWSAQQKAKIHTRLRLYDGVVRWGEDYHGRVDGMHLEINDDVPWVRVHQLAMKIKAGLLGHGAKSYLVGREPFAATSHPHDHEHGPRHTYPAKRGPFRAGQHDNAWVHMIQERLKALGFYDGPVNGDYSHRLKQAVESFQEHERIGVDGVVGPVTWGRIFR